MSIQEVHTPTSTTGSSAPDSPLESHAPITPDSAVGPNGGFNDSSETVMQKNAAANTSAAAGSTQKRKPSRRANTAERRATHNAVERQRRETLNGRFLDLAALLPNLASVRRPSKSAIVNSSIAIIHSARRQRLIAARELRNLLRESDALRRECNEWRDRAGLPRCEEPPRTPEFMNLLTVGEESEHGAGMGGSQMNGMQGWWDEQNLSEMGEEERRAYELVMRANAGDEDGDGLMDEDEDYGRVVAQTNPTAAYKGVAPVQQQPQQAQITSRGQQQPQVMRQNSFGFDLPSTGSIGGMYDVPPVPHHGHSHSNSMPNFAAFANNGNMMQEPGLDKLGAWANNLGFYGGNGNVSSMPQWAHSLNSSPHHQSGRGHHHHTPSGLFTPPGSASGAASAGTGSPVSLPQGFNGGGSPTSYALMGNGANGHVYASPELDDGASVGSNGGGGNGTSSGGSPQAPLGSFVGSEGLERRGSLGLGGLEGGQWGAGMAMPVPVSVGGAGAGRGAMMSMML